MTAALAAQSPITTLFAQNNGGAPGGAAYFDITVTDPAGLTFHQIDLNCGQSPGAAIGCSIHIAAAGWSAVDPVSGLATYADPTAWTQVASGTGQSFGTDTPSPVCLAGQGGFYLAPGTYGMAVVMDATTSHRYTNGNGTNQNFSTAECSLDLGGGANTAFGTSVFQPRVWNGSLYYNSGTTVGTCVVTPVLVGEAETIPNPGGPMGSTGGGFSDGDVLRWAYDDVGGSFPGAPALTVLNYGGSNNGGAALPVGVTAFLPGFNQVWAGSTPSGYADIVNATVGLASEVIVGVPSGLFAVGDTVRIQGIVLDLNGTNLGEFLRPTPNSLNFVRVPSCLISEGFEGVASGAGNYPTGWSSGGGLGQWQPDTSGTPSGNTGPTSGSGGSAVYMYCETSGASGPDYIMNTDTYSLAGATTVGFDLSRVGATIGTLEVRMDDGSGTYPTVLATYTGPDPNGAEWTIETIALPAGAPASASFQFHYVKGASFTGDIAIDGFCIN
ncbi:MAG: hypothetical protein VX044_07955 [Planctomycetota bacterium]|nr:hypothetical protein [Planctomycetota bacterium]